MSSVFFPDDDQESACLEWSNLRDALEARMDARCPVEVTPVPSEWETPTVMDEAWRTPARRAYATLLSEAFP